MTQDPYKGYNGKTELANYSGLRLFSQCPRLYYEQYIAKTYVEPERDYFVYGLLVDAMLTSPEAVEARFIRVDRTVSAENALQYEVDIRGLENELIPIREKAAEGNKTALKGVEKREREIAELNVKLAAIKEIKTKQQVTASVWDHAQATAEAIKRNPMFPQLEWNALTSQSEFYSDRIRRKGRLDYFRLSEPAMKIYAMWKTKAITEQQMRVEIAKLPEECRTGIIVDIKTTAKLSQLDPFCYAGQLGFYQTLVEDVTGIRCDCYIIAGDKDTELKRAQDFKFSQEVLDQAKEQVAYIEKLFWLAKENNIWPSAKELRGIKQDCFKCSSCADRPFSLNEPYLVTGPKYV